MAAQPCPCHATPVEMLLQEGRLFVACPSCGLLAFPAEWKPKPRATSLDPNPIEGRYARAEALEDAVADETRWLRGDDAQGPTR